MKQNTWILSGDRLSTMEKSPWIINGFNVELLYVQNNFLLCALQSSNLPIESHYNDEECSWKAQIDTRNVKI